VIKPAPKANSELRFIDKLREGKGAPEGGDRAAPGRPDHFVARASSQPQRAVPTCVSWKLEQQVPSPAKGWSLLPGRLHCSLPPAGGKPIAIYNDGWSTTAADWPPMPGSAWRGNGSGRYMFWGPQLLTVVEKSPAAKTSWEPNGLAPRSSPPFTTKPELYLALVAEASAPTARSSPGLCFPSDSGRARPRTASSCKLLMAYPAQPLRALVAGPAHQFVPGPARRTRFTHGGSARPLRRSSSGPMLDECGNNSAAGQAMGQRLRIAPGLEALNLRGFLDLTRQHHPAPAFRAIHFQARGLLPPTQQ